MIAVVIGNFASILANIDAANALKRERVASVTSYLRSRKIPTPLQRRILAYFRGLALTLYTDPNPNADADANPNPTALLPLPLAPTRKPSASLSLSLSLSLTL